MAVIWKKKAPPEAGLSSNRRKRFVPIPCETELDLANVGSRRTLRTVNDLKAHPGAFGQGLEAFGLNGGVMDEYILAAVLLNKTETLSIIEPLNCTFSHLYYSL